MRHKILTHVQFCKGSEQNLYDSSLLKYASYFVKNNNNESAMFY